MEYFLYYCKFASIAVFHGLHTYTTCNNMWSIHTIANKFNYGGLPSKIHKGHKLKIKTLCALSHELLWWEHNTEAVPSPQWDVPPMLLSEKKENNKENTHTLYKPASVAQLDALSDWRPGGRGFNLRRGRQHSFVEIDHEIFSTVILSLPLIQEGQLSVSGERMCTILVNCLED